MKYKILLFLSVIYSTTFSQNEVYNKFIHLTTADGLSQSSVIAIEQDRLKQLWIGTRDGLNKYDGKTFTTFRNNPQDQNSLCSNDILSIKEDHKGFIWIGTYNGISRFDPTKNTFKSYYQTNKKGSISNNIIWKIALVNEEELWFGTSNGLLIYNAESDSFKTIQNDSENPTSLSDNHVLDIYQDREKTIWIATKNGLNKLVERTQSTFVLNRFNTENSNLKDAQIQSIAEDQKGVLWLGTKFGGLYKSDRIKSSFSAILKTVESENINNDVRSLTVDNDNNLWIATYNGLYLKKNDGKVIHVQHQRGNSKSLSRNTLKKVFVDAKGSVWIGAYYGGLNLWDKSNTNVISLYKNNNTTDIEYGVVSAMAQSKNGTIYFGTEGKGISVLNPNSQTLELPLPKGKKLPSNNIKSLFLNHTKLWIGTYNAGVIVYDIVKQDFDSEIISSDLKKITNNQGVYAIKKVKDNILLGIFGKGLCVYNPKNKEIIDSNQLSKSLTDTSIRTITLDQKENIWIGTQNGLNVITSNNFTKKPVVQKYLFNKEQVSGDDVLCVFETQRGQLLVGTKANGLYEIIAGKFEQLNFNIPNTTISTVYSILEDNNYNLWLSTNQGIVNYAVHLKSATLFNKSEGLINNEFVNNSSLKKFDGTLFFGGSNGISFLDPTHLETNTYAPQVILTGLKVQGKIITDYSKENVLTKPLAYTKAITLNHEQKSFTVNYAIPNFINSANNKYQYRLLGLDDDWQYTKNTEINFTIQKPGTYQFEVKAANNDTVWNVKPTILTITIKPAPWRTIWAYMAYGFLLLLIFLGIIRSLKARQKLQQELVLEHLESERRKELNQSKLEFFTNISHEFRTPLALIIGPLQQIIQDYHGSNKMYKKLLVIERNAAQLLTLINQFLDFRKFENKHSKLQVAEGNFVKFLKEIFLSFNEFAKLGNYTYTFESESEKIAVYYDRYKLERVFYNLISNAFKYTPEGGEIHLKVYEKNNDVFIEVKDSGRGISPAFLKKIFERFYEVAGGKEYQKHFNQGSGIGLFIAKKAVDLHQGNLTVKSEEGKGSMFTVQLQKGSNHFDEDTIIKDFKFSDDISQYKAQLTTEFNNVKEIASSSNEEKKHTLLIVEDNDELRQFMKDILKETYHILEAENGEVGFKKALQKLPDLIISDVIMPKMEGTALCAKIKNDIRTSHIPLILLTSRTSLIYKYNGLESGADAYINKPFNVKEFLLTVKNMLFATDKLKEKFSSDSSFKSEDYTVTSIDEQLLKKAIKIVEENISNSSFDIPFFSSELGVSRTMLFSKIKGWTNLTPNEFIHSIRMKRATQLLELGEINIAEVCYKVGFKNPKYFTKCFKKHYNITPSEYAAKFY